MANVEDDDDLVEDINFFHDQVRINGRCRGLIDALALTSKHMNTLVGTGPAYDAVRDLYGQLEAKLDEIDALRNPAKS